MDTLALLCNLHADGPATLHRLRRAGCESLAALCRLEAGALALRLEWNERTAERFLREAALLAERVQEDEPASSGPEAPAFELESILVEELDAATIEGEEEDEDAELEEEAEEELEEVAEQRAIPLERVQAVLGAWRELDRVAPPSEPVEFLIPRPPPAPDCALFTLELEGFTPRLVARLAQLGITSLRQFVERPELELARALPLQFTRLKHLLFAARQRLDTLPAPSPQPMAFAPTPVEAAFEPFSPPPSDPFETAGPFA